MKLPFDLKRTLRSSTALAGLGGPPVRRGEASASGSRDSGTTEIWLDEEFEADLFQGQLGLVISNPMVIAGRSVSVSSSNLDPLEIRRSLLYWEKLIWPKSRGIYIGHGPDIEYLESLGVLLCPSFGVNGDAAIGLLHAFVETYKRLEAKQPGQWALSSAADNLLGQRQDFVTGRGALTKFFAMIPVPQRDVPFEDILNFKERRCDELKKLQCSIGEFYQSWVNSEDQAHQLQLCASRIDIACAEAIRVVKEARIPFGLSTWKVSFSFAATDVARAAMGVFAAHHLNFPLMTSLALGVAPFIQISSDVGPIGTKKDMGAFNYVSHIEREFGF